MKENMEKLEENRISDDALDEVSGGLGPFQVSNLMMNKNVKPNLVRPVLKDRDQYQAQNLFLTGSGEDGDVNLLDPNGGTPRNQAGNSRDYQTKPIFTAEIMRC